MAESPEKSGLGEKSDSTVARELQQQYDEEAAQELQARGSAAIENPLAPPGPAPLAPLDIENQNQAGRGSLSPRAQSMKRITTQLSRQFSNPYVGGQWIRGEDGKWIRPRSSTHKIPRRRSCCSCFMSRNKGEPTVGDITEVTITLADGSEEKLQMGTAQTVRQLKEALSTKRGFTFHEQQVYHIEGEVPEEDARLLGQFDSLKFLVIRDEEGGEERRQAEQQATRERLRLEAFTREQEARKRRQRSEERKKAGVCLLGTVFVLGLVGACSYVVFLMHDDELNFPMFAGLGAAALVLCCITCNGCALSISEDSDKFDGFDDNGDWSESPPALLLLLSAFQGFPALAVMLLLGAGHICLATGTACGPGGHGGGIGEWSKRKEWAAEWLVAHAFCTLPVLAVAMVVFGWIFFLGYAFLSWVFTLCVIWPPGS